MSVSIGPLFTGGQPPGPLLTNLHGVLDDFVEQACILAHRAEPRIRRRRGDGRRLAFPELANRLAYHVILFCRT
jgi:hypothetical protein